MLWPLKWTSELKEREKNGFCNSSYSAKSQFNASCESPWGALFVSNLDTSAALQLEKSMDSVIEFWNVALIGNFKFIISWSLLNRFKWICPLWNEFWIIIIHHTDYDYIFSPLTPPLRSIEKSWNGSKTVSQWYSKNKARGRTALSLWRSILRSSSGAVLWGSCRYIKSRQEKRIDSIQRTNPAQGYAWSSQSINCTSW